MAQPPRPEGDPAPVTNALTLAGALVTGSGPVFHCVVRNTVAPLSITTFSAQMIAGASCPSGNLPGTYMIITAPYTYSPIMPFYSRLASTKLQEIAYVRLFCASFPASGSVATTGAVRWPSKFAILVGILFSVIFGVRQLGLLFWTRSALQMTAAMTARCVAIGTCTTDDTATAYAQALAGTMAAGNILAGGTRQGPPGIALLCQFHRLHRLQAGDDRDAVLEQCAGRPDSGHNVDRFGVLRQSAPSCLARDTGPGCSPGGASREHPSGLSHP